jgi:Myb-like DNA-binding domain
MAATTTTALPAVLVVAETEAAPEAAPEAAAEADAHATTTSPPPPTPPPLASLKFALENAFQQLNNDEFEAECAIEQSRRQLPFVHALRNAFLHLQEPEFESVQASERERRRVLDEANRLASPCNARSEMMMLLADCHAKVRASVKSRKSAASTENGIAKATTADTDTDDDDDDDNETADRDDANEVAASRTGAGDAGGLTSRSIKNKTKKRGSPLSSDDSSSDKKKKHKKDSSSSVAPYSAIVAGHHRPRLFNNKHKNASSAVFKTNNKNTAATPYSDIVSRAATTLQDASTHASSLLLNRHQQHPPTSVSPDAVSATATALTGATAALMALPAPAPPQWRMVWMPSPMSQPCIQPRVSVPSMTNGDAERAMSMAATTMLSMVGQAPQVTATTTTGICEQSSSKNGQPQQQQKKGDSVFGWTKEEDMRLTDIMKKYKNPTNWEPIAKQLGRNRTYD